MKIAIDVMSGDHGLKSVLPAVIRARNFYKNKVKFILVGDEDLIYNYLNQNNIKNITDFIIQNSSEVVLMEDSPIEALRHKKNSSMRIALNLVRDNNADACVSAGNTGALVMTAKFVLKTISGISRPAIMAPLPTISGHANMLDLGANISCDSELLYKFAILGAIATSYLENIKSPKISLLNIGVEDIKGPDNIKLAAELISNNKNLNYIGFIEGDDIFTGKADIIVCDGFAGNIALKTIEGVVKLFYKKLHNKFFRSWYSKIFALFNYMSLNIFRKELDPRIYNGASLIGLNKTVVKSHGGADSIAFFHAICRTVDAVKVNLPRQLQDKFQSLSRGCL